MVGRGFATVALAAGLGLAAGCSKPAPPPAPAPVTPAPAPASGAISGRVLFEGDRVPEAKPLRLTTDPYCERAHPKGLIDDHYRINARREVADAVVYIRSGLPEGVKYPVPAEPVALDQVGCRYVPKVFLIRVGQTLRLETSDATLHNVHAQGHANRSFNLGMPNAGMILERVFDRPEVPVRFQCDVHPWMAAYAAVLDHPFGAVTGEDGAYALEGLPDGIYDVEVWHSRLGRSTASVRIERGAAVTQDFRLVAPVRSF
ncbi:MAG: hypothetical protein KC466_19420 [Myxococcales bacterium]|nr:hypothetical protein [Myxococcales bacterium]